MYKIIIKDKYQLYCGTNDKFIGEYDSIDELSEVTFDFIRTNELVAAINHVSDTSHNVMEFGSRGYFTVSYRDTKHE